VPTQRPAPDLLSHFWAPLCAVGSHGPSGPNAQVCVSIFGASIVPERPRLLVNLSRTNYTTGLVTATGSLVITLLSDRQVDLLDPLGLHSGRDRDKLTTIPFALTPAGDPYFPGGVGAVDCAVIESFDLGDSVAFLCAVRDRYTLEAGNPLPWAKAREVVGDDFLRRWAEKSQREQAAAFQAMRWL
jgi:flavin reductase (DIM6/NTAB) family NADH-FMN oxidoreductase RutF